MQLSHNSIILYRWGPLFKHWLIDWLIEWLINWLRSISKDNTVFYCIQIIKMDGMIYYLSINWLIDWLINQETGGRVLPLISSSVIDPEKSVRDQGFKVLRGFISKLEKVNQKLFINYFYFLKGLWTLFPETLHILYGLSDSKHQAETIYLIKYDLDILVFFSLKLIIFNYGFSVKGTCGFM